jgi:hypothetical protein
VYACPLPVLVHVETWTCLADLTPLHGPDASLQGCGAIDDTEPRLLAHVDREGLVDDVSCIFHL